MTLVRNYKKMLAPRGASFEGPKFWEKSLEKKWACSTPFCTPRVEQYLKTKK